MAASSSITTFKYSPAGPPIFEGENYHFWSTQMRTFFISKDLWDLVENSYESPQSQEEYSAWSEARKEKLKEHKMKDAKALYYIQQAITITIAPRIMAATKSKEAWEILKNEFQGSEKAIVAKRQTLWREFDNLMMEEGESFEIFFSRVFTVINQLKGCGGIIPDKRAVEKVLRSLPIKYDRVVAGIKESTNLSTLTLHELMGSLQVDEERMNRFSDQPFEQAFLCSSITTFKYSPAGPPIFEGENYHFWSTQMRTFFISKDLWDLVENSYESPQSQEEYSAWSEARKEKLKEHKMKDAKALYYIQQAITITIAPRIMAATKSKEAWEILKNEFQGWEKAIVAKRQTLWREFDNLMMEEGESIEIFFARVFTVINQLKGCGGIIRDKRAVEKVLRSLPVKYDRVVAGIKESTNLSTLTLHKLMGSLQVDEERVNRFSDQLLEQSFQTKMNMSEKTDGGNKRQNQGSQFQRGQSNRGHGRGGKMHTQRTARDISQSESCCSKNTNHGSMDCSFKKLTRFKNNNHLEKDSGFRKKDEANFSEKGETSNQQCYPYMNSQQEPQDTLDIDSRCSNHMMGNKSSFVSLDDGKFQNIKGKMHTQRTARDISQSESCCKFCKNTNHGSMDCSFKKLTKFKNNNHLEKDSGFRKKDEANFSEKGESSNQQCYPYMNSQQEPQDTLDIDSRCSNHMMGNKSSFVSLDDGKFQNIKGKSTIAVKTKGAMEASTSSEVNFQIPASSRIPLSVPSVVEGESAISGFTSTFQSEESLPLISRPDGLGKLQSVEGMTIQKSFELMDNVKPIQNVVKALATNDELRNAFLKVKEVQEFKQRLKTGDND
ncbi:uncharacterized protein LOC114274210 [Camellia sinensis]|uniref:uncharacterized protein LOC114274210 n=1 Tax=Camellia sinensis TaxID=4442 RepID=UPI001036A3AB|nr:uncharacterized protein LOC114274210 [Camellia sinensis]XP_028071893.1 uncharacterized protein LOC114274210 [Camellia sinensis]